MKRIELKKSRAALVAVIISFSITFLPSCQEENEAMEVSESEEIALVENTTNAEDAADQDMELANLAEFEVAGQQRTITEKCYTTNWDPNSRILTIDFGESCIGPFGRERSGKIIISYSSEGRLFISDRTISFENYFVNNRSISGQIEITRGDRNANGNLENTYTLNAYTITFPNEGQFIVNGSRTREWVAGEGDEDRYNNIFSITGNLEGSASSGRAWTHTITEPIIADFGCLRAGNMLRKSGIKEITHSFNNRVRSRIVDYGDGACDNSYTVNIDNKIVTING